MPGSRLSEMKNSQINTSSRCQAKFLTSAKYLTKRDWSEISRVQTRNISRLLNSRSADYFISLRALFDWVFPFADFRFKLYYCWTLTFTTSGQCYIVSIQLINSRIWKFMYNYYPTKWLYKYACCLLSCEIYEPMSLMRMVCAWAVLQ
jgi:hypothetical protein